MFPLSPKQKEFWNEPFHRYNIKYGATRAGKTYLDYFMIPRRMIERRDKDGLFVFIGNSKGTLQRNVIEPMMNIYGAANVSSIRSDNTCTIFGMKVHCLGADNAAREDKLRGMSIKYCYGDEIVTWNERVFEMLKSRLDKPYSCLDATCNPGSPSHWVKKFIDSDADVFSQRYMIDDNPYLEEEVRESMKKEHSGVFYQRYILGEWCAAEGLIYPAHAEAFEEPYNKEWQEYALSIDYGTQNAFAALLWGRDGNTWHVFREYRYSGRETMRQKTDSDYVKDMEEFTKDVPDEIITFVDPSATSFIEALRRSKRGFRIRHADNAVLDGIRDVSVCIQNGTIKFFKTCTELKKEFEGYVWVNEEGKEERPQKVNDHLMDTMRYFVRTKRLVKPIENYTSPFGG